MKRKRKKKKFKITPQIIILFLLVLVVSRNLYSKQLKSKTIELSDIENYENTLSITGTVIREEYLISYGEMINTDKEVLDRISALSNIGSINGFKNNLDLNLETSKEKADKLYKMENIYYKKSQKTKEEKLQDDTETKSPMDAEYIYTKVKDGEIKSLKNLNEFDYDYLKKNREELNYLKNKYSVISEVLSKNGENLKVPVSGVVLNKIDGYEDILNPYDIDLENFEFKIPDDVKEDMTIDGSKIVNNNFFYLYFKTLTSNLSKGLEAGDTIKIKIGKDYLNGRIEQILDTDKETKFLIKFDEGFKIVENKRFLNFKLIKDEEKTFLVPTSSIIEKDGIWGVYVKNPSGIVKFVAVKIVGEKEKSTFVSAGKDGMITFGGKNYETLTLYDEVLIHPNLVKDKELLE